MIEKIESPNVPKAFGPYSHGVKAGNFVFLSGQLGLDPQTNQLKEGVKEQARQALNNLKAVLETAGCKMTDVARCDVFLANIDDFAAVNAEYEKFFNSDPKPARQTAAVSALPKNALVEISCIALAP